MRLDEATKDIKIIMLTGVSEMIGVSYSGEDMGDLYGTEPEAFIDKPVDPVTLRDTVRELLGAPPAP